MFEKVFSGSFLDSFVGISVQVGKSKVKISTDANVAVGVVGGLGFQGSEEIEEALPRGEVAGGAVAVECSPD